MARPLVANDLDACSAGDGAHVRGGRERGGCAYPKADRDHFSWTPGIGISPRLTRSAYKLASNIIVLMRPSANLKR